MNKENNNNIGYSGTIQASAANVVACINNDNTVPNTSDSLYVMNDDFMSLVKPLNITWNPQEDITTFELAQCMPLLYRIYSYPVMPYEINESEPIMRHFKIINSNNK